MLFLWIISQKLQAMFVKMPPCTFLRCQSVSHFNTPHFSFPTSLFWSSHRHHGWPRASYSAGPSRWCSWQGGPSPTPAEDHTKAFYNGLPCSKSTNQLEEYFTPGTLLPQTRTFSLSENLLWTRKATKINLIKIFSLWVINNIYIYIFASGLNPQKVSNSKAFFTKIYNAKIS